MIRWFLSFPYFFKESLLDMRENRGVAVLTLLTATISLMFLGALWIVQVNVSRLIDNWGEKFQVSVFFSDDATSGQKKSIRRIILNSGLADRVEEMSSSEALKRFRRQLGANAGVLEGLGEAVLPSSLSVILRPGERNMTNIESLMARLRVMPGVERLRNDLEWLRRLEGAIQLLRLTVWTVSILLGLGVLFIIANTIRMTLFARRDDIAIMHLVGATDGFIKTPYVTEGTLCGAFGGCAAYLVLLLVYYVFFMPMLNTYSAGEIQILTGGWSLGVGLIGIGGALGFLGSVVTVGHYLRQQRE